jgi:ribosomal protein L37E
MDLDQYAHERMKRIIENNGLSRRGHPVEGMPGDPMNRHTCIDCGHKKYEKKMIPTGLVKENNFKAWLLWRCQVCGEDSHNDQRYKI